MDLRAVFSTYSTSSAERACLSILSPSIFKSDSFLTSSVFFTSLLLIVDTLLMVSSIYFSAFLTSSIMCLTSAFLFSNLTSYLDPSFFASLPITTFSLILSSFLSTESIFLSSFSDLALILASYFIALLFLLDFLW